MLHRAARERLRALIWALATAILKSTMPDYRIAAIQDQGLNLLLVPVGPTFEALSTEQRQRFLDCIEEQAAKIGRHGRAVIFWRDANGHTKHFDAPGWNPILGDWDLNRIQSHLNEMVWCEEE
jgi:hypothetical protein